MPTIEPDLVLLSNEPMTPLSNELDELDELEEAAPLMRLLRISPPTDEPEVELALVAPSD